jgi:hypothetical protein
VVFCSRAGANGKHTGSGSSESSGGSRAAAGGGTPFAVTTEEESEAMAPKGKRQLVNEGTLLDAVRGALPQQWVRRGRLQVFGDASQRYTLAEQVRFSVAGSSARFKAGQLGCTCTVSTCRLFTPWWHWPSPKTRSELCRRGFSDGPES